MKTWIEAAGFKGPQLLENNPTIHLGHQKAPGHPLWATLPPSTHYSILSSAIFGVTCPNAVLSLPVCPLFQHLRMT